MVSYIKAIYSWPWGPQKSKNKLTAALWTQLFQKKDPVYHVTFTKKRKTEETIINCSFMFHLCWKDGKKYINSTNLTLNIIYSIQIGSLVIENLQPNYWVREQFSASESNLVRQRAIQSVSGQFKASAVNLEHERVI